MKIAIAGAHRVGKTTLAEKLQESLKNYTHRQEPYYDLEERGHTFAETPNVDDFLAQLEYSIEQITSTESNTIFDRCPLDLLAYIQALGNDEVVHSFYDDVQTAMAEIDLLVFVPIEHPDLIGCSEYELPKLRQKVDKILHEWIMDFDIDTLQVTGTISEREQQIMSKVSTLQVM